MAAMSTLADGAFLYEPGVDYALQTMDTALLCPPNMELDPDRTPRRSDFAPSVQDLYTSQYPSAPPQMGYMVEAGDASAHSQSDEAYAFDRYIQGLDAFNIMPSTDDVLPFADVDFSELYV
jgi:hypothetical protein